MHPHRRTKFSDSLEYAVTAESLKFVHAVCGSVGNKTGGDGHKTVGKLGLQSRVKILENHSSEGRVNRRPA